MGDLTGKRIDLTYDGILKTSDEGPLTGVIKTIQDGLGNNSGLQMAQAGGNYTTVITSDSVYTNGLTVGNTGTAFGGTVDFQTSSVDFTNSTVIGLPASGVTSIIAGSNITVSSATGDVTIDASGSTDTTYDLDTIQSIGQIELNLNGSDASQSTLVISEGSNVTLIDDAGAGFTISATDTNTTYTLDSAQSGTNVEIQLDGSDASTDFVTLVAGTNITLTEAGGNVTIDAAGGGGGGLENYMYYPWSATGVSGYGPTYARFTQPLNGTGYWNTAIDQNPNTGILSQMYVEPDLEINVFVNAFLGVSTNDTYELAVYDTWDNGSPKDKVFSTSVSVIGASGDQYVETPVSWIPTGTRYWFGLQSASGTASKMGMFDREAVSNMFGNYGGWGPSPVGVSPINALFYNGGAFPATLSLGAYYNHRDEVLVALYKTV